MLYSFNGPDGTNPQAGVIVGPDGNVYGDTFLGGTLGGGVIFQLVPGNGDQWTENVLHNLRGSTDGGVPESTLVFDAAGSLYGTTSGGGIHNGGTVFRLSPSGGAWTFDVLYSFEGRGGGGDGWDCRAGVILDATGNLYGTTVGGGEDRSGTVFELSPGQSGWTERILYSFHLLAGAAPKSALRFDQAGDLYGTTANGGPRDSCGGLGCGTVFKLTPGTDGVWTQSVFRFPENGSMGLFPVNDAPLYLDSLGNVYGVTYQGGKYDGGVLFEIPNTAGNLQQAADISISR